VREDPRTRAAVRVVRVERVLEFVTCCDCWRRPAVQVLLKEARRSGRAPGD